MSDAALSKKSPSIMGARRSFSSPQLRLLKTRRRGCRGDGERRWSWPNFDNINSQSIRGLIHVNAQPHSVSALNDRLVCVY
jgi:hypothetical protein